MTGVRWFALALACLALTRARADSPPPAEVKDAFLKLLDRPRAPLDAKTTSTRVFQRDLTIEHVEFATELRPDGRTERVPALVVRPTKPGGKRAAVVVLHGTGGHKAVVFPWLMGLARKGFVAIAFDARFHGDRAGEARGAWAYNAAIIRAWRSVDDKPIAHPLYYDTCWDVWRTVDYLQARPDVDPDRVGLVGISMGGIEAVMAAAVDDRIKVVVPAISVQSFRWSLDNDRWEDRARTIGPAVKTAARDLGKVEADREVCRALWTKVTPGLLDEFDCPSIIRLLAGRPLLILNGEHDPLCPIEGDLRAFRSADQAYRAASARDRLRIVVAHDGGHMVTHDQFAEAIRWLVRWLEPAA